MSKHHAKILWNRNSIAFDYAEYPRDHFWEFTGGYKIPASAAPDYLGSDDRVDPEEAFVAALSSCHMLTFLAIAAKKKFVVDEYTDSAVGYLEKDAEGRFSVTRVVLNPVIKFAPGANPTENQLDDLHEGAHRNCFIANSVKTQVTIAAN